MKDEVKSLIRTNVEDLTISTTDTAQQLLLRFNHQELFDVISEYMNDPTIGRLEWIICIETLCYIDQDQANKRFVQALQVDDPDKRYRVVKQLYGYGTEVVVPSLIKMLREDVDPSIRYMVATALGEIGDRRALPALQWSVENDHGLNFDDDPIALRSKAAIKQIVDRN